MTALTHSPTLPAPKRQVAITLGATDSDADYVRVWCTIAPTGSELDGKLNNSKDPRSRVIVFEGQFGNQWNATFDKGGKYTFVAQEYLKGAGYGGGYEGDPNGAALEEKLGSETTLIIYVGQRGTQQIGPPGNQATLVVWVWDETIYRTTKAEHGEDSPAITAQSPSPSIKTAMESSTVTAALTALGAGVTAAAATGNLATIVYDYWNQYDGHVQAFTHPDDDLFNYLNASFSNAYGQKDLQEFVNKALQLIKYHVTNDASLDTAGGVFGPGSASYHNSSDRASLPLYDNVGSFSDAYAALADLHRCYESHRVAEPAHDSPDTGHALAALPLILQVHSAFLTVLASTNPPVPPAQSIGMQTLISLAGFKE